MGACGLQIRGIRVLEMEQVWGSLGCKTSRVESFGHSEVELRAWDPLPAQGVSF